MWKHEKLFWRCNTISELMINEQIRDREVRLIGENGEQLGIMSVREAMKLAEEAELDLVKIAPTAKPPVFAAVYTGPGLKVTSPALNVSVPISDAASIFT